MNIKRETLWRNYKLSPILLLCWNLCAVVFLASTAFNQWPGLHHDSALYTTPIINAAATGRWEFDSYIPGLLSFGSNSYNLHGQLYQLVFGKVLRCDSYESLFRWTAVVNVLTYLAYLLLGWRVFLRRYGAAAGWLASGTAAVAALSCVYLQGRPEHLLPLLLIVPFLVHEWPPVSAYAKHFAYIAMGLTVVLSPIPGMLAILGVGAWIILRHGNRWVWEVLSCCLLAVPSALLVLFLVCPVGPVEWVHNTLSNGAKATGFFSPGFHMDLGVFMFPALLEVPFWNVFSLGVLSVFLVTLWKRGLWWFAVLYFAGIFVVLMPKTAIYSYFGFMPILMLGILWRETELISLPPKLKLLPVLLVSSFGAVGAAGLLRAILLAILFAGQGVSFSQTKASVRALEGLVDATKEKIGFIWLVRPSFEAFSTPENFLVTITLNGFEGDKEIYLTEYENKFNFKVKYLLMPQLGHITKPLPTLNDGMFILQENGWVAKRARFLGLKLGGPMPGYQFALYRRNPRN